MEIQTSKGCLRHLASECGSLQHVPLGNFRLVDIPTYSDERGALSVVESEQIPFAIARVFFIYKTPVRSHRGGHCHTNSASALIAVHGAVTVTLDTGRDRQSVRLQSPTQALVIDPLTWIELDEWNNDAVCLALSSTRFQDTNYIRDYQSFMLKVSRDN